MIEVGLVLGGGGARGYAHIGVIKALEERKVNAVAVAGCSMGGIVGALYCSGRSADVMLERARNFKFSEFIDRGDTAALMRTNRLEKVMSEALPATFEELAVPFKVTACDIQEGVQVVIDQGDLPAAVRATISLPGVFPPARMGDRILLDGGLVNNLPVDIIRAMTPKPVIAVDVGAPPDRKLNFDKHNSWYEFIKTRTFKRPLIMEIAMKAYDIPQRLLTDARVALNPPDIFVRPPIDPEIKVEDFDMWEQPYEAGLTAMRKALDEQGFEIGMGP